MLDVGALLPRRIDTTPQPKSLVVCIVEPAIARRSPQSQSPNLNLRPCRRAHVVGARGVYARGEIAMAGGSEKPCGEDGEGG